MLFKQLWIDMDSVRAIGIVYALLIRLQTQHFERIDTEFVLLTNDVVKQMCDLCDRMNNSNDTMRQLIIFFF